MNFLTSNLTGEGLSLHAFVIEIEVSGDGVGRLFFHPTVPLDLSGLQTVTSPVQDFNLFLGNGEHSTHPGHFANPEINVMNSFFELNGFILMHLKMTLIFLVAGSWFMASKNIYKGQWKVSLSRLNENDYFVIPFILVNPLFYRKLRIGKLCYC